MACGGTGWTEIPSKYKGNDQELVLSNPTSHPQNKRARRPYTNSQTLTKDTYAYALLSEPSCQYRSYQYKSSLTYLGRGGISKHY